MEIKYFPDTDTAHIEFSKKEIVNTKEISQNVYIDFDNLGNIVSMTIEHANSNANIKEFSFKEMKAHIG